MSLFNKSFATSYCTPGYFPLYGCSFGDEINTFTLVGESSTSISDLNSGCSSGNYEDSHLTMTVTLNQGTNYTVSTNTASILNPDNIQIWIDFNDDGTFSTTESVGGGAITTSLTNISISIPTGATVGSHRMRAVVSGSEVYPALLACPTVLASIFGEVHDYTAVIATGSVVTCPAPTGLTASGITSTSANLSWNTATGAVGYEYVVDNSASAPTGSGTATIGTTYNPTGLTPATTYYLHVRTNCGSGSFSAWVTIPFTTLAAVCAPPTGLTASGVTSTSANLSWNTVASATGYEYVVDNSAAAPSGSGTATTGTTYNPTGLTPATTYYLHVRINCGGGNFSTWVTIPFNTSAAGCNAPTGLTASGITSTSANLSWTAVVGATGYEYVVDNSASAPTGSGTATTGTTYNPTGLTPATTYYLHVRTNCGSSNFSSWTTIPFTTLATAGFVNVSAGNEISLSVYPNPVKDVITVSISGKLYNDHATIMLTDIAGRIINLVVSETEKVNIDMKQLPAGLYLIQYTDGINKKIVKVTKSE
ncbi:MAG: fibronectin type III domain-containing protein [Bacteroidota bacterium]